MVVQDKETEIKKVKEKGLEGRNKDPDGKKEPVGMGKTVMYAHSFIQKEKYKDRRTHSQRDLLLERDHHIDEVIL